MKETRSLLGKEESLQKAWESQWPALAEIDRESFRGLVEVNKITTEIFFEHTAFSEYHTILGEDKESRKTVKDAIGLHSFPGQDTLSESKYAKLLEGTHVKEQLARSYILKHIEEGTTFGMKPWELDVLATSCRVAGDYDVLGGLWRQQVQENPLNEKAKELNLTNQYTVIQEGKNGPEEISFAEAFEEQISTIVREFLELANRIESDDQETIDMATYLNAYAEALGSTDLDKLPNLWREVDRTWLNIKGKLQPIASREYDYYDKNGIRVFPDYRLGVQNTESKLFEGVENTRKAMIKYLGKEFGGVPVYEETKNGMSQVQILPEVYDVVFAAALDFQPVGQFLPNEFEVKKRYGIKVFLNLQVGGERWGLALDLVKKVFPDHVEQFDQVDHEFDGTVLHTAGHEFGEPLFDTDKVRRKLGEDVFILLNEDVATLAGFASLPSRVESGELPEKILETQALDSLGIYLRYIDHARGAPHLQPYYKGMGLQGLRRMVNSGFIRLEGDKLVIDNKGLDLLYFESQVDLRKHVHIANSQDRKIALDYLEPIKTAESIPEIQKMIEIIHPEEAK